MRVSIITTECRRCGKPVATVSRSILGADETYERYSGICSNCITPEEQEEIIRLQAEAILRGR